MQSPEELGCDERSSEMLRSFPAEQQEMAMEKLRRGLETGKVRNASAYLVSVLNDAEILGVDDRAMQMLKELPEPTRKAVIQKLRQTPDVRNPSAWIANKVLKIKKEGGLGDGRMGAPVMQSFGQPMMMHQPQMLGRQNVVGGGVIGGCGGGGGFGFNSLDQRAQELLKALPKPMQQEILGKLMMQPHVNNPSAWVAKAAMAAGATPGAAEAAPQPPADAGVGAQEPYDDFDPQVAQLLQSFALDAGARRLLLELPVEQQLDIAGKLASKTDITNPSGWVVKNCINAGARSGDRPPAQARAVPLSAGVFSAPPSFAAVAPPSMMPAYGAATPQAFIGGMAGQGNLDHGARELLSTLAPHVQQDILGKMAAVNPKNPSGWVVKAAISAGARRPSPSSASPMTMPSAGPVSLPQGCQVDDKAQSLLAGLAPHLQRDIILKLTNSWNDGAIKNPSAWVAKACMKAGAQTTPGMGGISQGAVRYAPY